MTTAIGEFEVLSRTEDVYFDVPGGGKLSRVRLEHQFTGDISGRGDLERLVCYRLDGTAHFVGLQRIFGAVGGELGSFVIESVGDSDRVTSRGVWSVISGSGTAGLTGIHGQGDFEAPSGPRAWFTLDYSLS